MASSSTGCKPSHRWTTSNIAFVSGVDGLQATIRAQNLQPCGKEQINLAGIFAERGKTGGVPCNIKGSANAFLGIKGDLGKDVFELLAAPCAGDGGEAAFSRAFSFSPSFSA